MSSDTLIPGTIINFLGDRLVVVDYADADNYMYGPKKGDFYAVRLRDGMIFELNWGPWEIVNGPASR